MESNRSQNGGNAAKLLYRLFAAVLLLIGLHSVSSSQEILNLFLSGDKQYRMMGENSFILSKEDRAMDPSHVSSPSVKYSYEYDNIYNETHADGTETRISKYSRLTDIVFPLSKNAYQPLVGVRLSSSQFTGLSSHSREDIVSFRGDKNRFSLYYAMNLSHVIRFGALAGQSYGNENLVRNYESNIVLLLTPHIRFMLAAGNISSPQALQLNITGINGVMPLDYQLQNKLVAFHGDWSNLLINITAQRAEILPVDDIEREWETKFLPQGKLNTVTAKIIYKISSQWNGLCSYASQIVDGSGKLVSRNSQYGKFAGFRYSSDELTIALQHNFSERGLFEANLQWKNITGDITGFVESWPFVSLFDSPFGQRENFNLSGSMKYWKIHTGSILPVSNNIDIGLGITALHLLPNMHLSSWESKFLTYTPRAYQERSLAVHYLRLGILSTGLRADFGTINFTYSMNQLIPLQIIRDESFTGDEIGSVGTGTNPVSQSLQTGGGQFHQFSVSYTF